MAVACIWQAMCYNVPGRGIVFRSMPLADGGNLGRQRMQAAMVYGWSDVFPVLASVTDGWAQGAVMALVMGVCVALSVVWLAKRRWEPAVQHLTSLVEREMHQADRAAQALRAGMQAQAARAQRQASSVHGAIAGVRALHNVTEELDQCASDLKHLAHLIAAESSSRRAAPGLADHVVSSAQQLALTAEQARQAYRRLHASVNQLVAEASSMQADDQEAEQHARDLTGAVERLRQGVHQQPRARPRRHETDMPRPRADAPPARRTYDEPPAAHHPYDEPSPPRDGRAAAPASRRYRPDAEDPARNDEPPHRHAARRDPDARPPEWYPADDTPDRRRSRDPEAERAGRERAGSPLRALPRARHAEDDSPANRPTRRRDDSEGRYLTRPPDRSRDDDSGWLERDDRRYSR
jgi:hypothetical protein